MHLTGRILLVLFLQMERLQREATREHAAAVEAMRAEHAAAVSEAVARLITPTLTQSLATPVMNYYYCMYCYYYGDYCQYCFYNRDMQWIGQKWWLGGEQGGVDS